MGRIPGRSALRRGAANCSTPRLSKAPDIRLERPGSGSRRPSSLSGLALPSLGRGAQCLLRTSVGTGPQPAHVTRGPARGLGAEELGASWPATSTSLVDVAGAKRRLVRESWSATSLLWLWFLTLPAALLASRAAMAAALLL